MVFQAFKQFFVFGCFSALGWLSDFFAFTLLVNLFGVEGFVANIISSYVGVTFVWFSSLKVVFGRTSKSHQNILFAYWIYQFVSIVCYSKFLHLVAITIQQSIFPVWGDLNFNIAAKVVVTPFNLITNFLFMKWLTRLMCRTDAELS